jgi:predicted adenylyl cyclase CyaB
MSRNIEIKARIKAVSALYEKAALLADAGPTDIVQEDVFFNCDRGRLKLRSFADGSGELIFYRRRDQAGLKESFYIRSPTTSPGSLCEALNLAYGEVGRVKKQRTLFLVGRTRVHLDRVEGLGDFLELEVVLRDEEDADIGVREAHELMRQLGIGADQLIEDAYIDLLVSHRPLVGFA